MLTKQAWMSVRSGIRWEVLQARDEGRKTLPVHAEQAEQIVKLEETDPEAAERMAVALTDALCALPMREDYPYEEPSELDAIFALRAQAPALAAPAMEPEAVYDRVYGAWLGRCAGCLLGQPIEGWMRERIVGLLRDTGNLPVKGYIRSDIDEAIREKWGVRDAGRVYGANKVNWINNVSHMPEDDDTNYTVIALKLMERAGIDFTPDDAAECWLMNLPLLHVCTAERVAYRNLANGMLPPASAMHYNAYREWIGAQIRGDFFGYVTPGNPELGATLAFRDASISHVKNGIYGEMWVAAMLSAAACTGDREQVIRAGLSQIPARSRLYEAIEAVLSGYAGGVSAEDAIERMRAQYNETVAHDWCHTIPNAIIVAIALLYGEGDFAKTLELSIIPGFDTDCSGATAGSILGMMLGAKALPSEWIAPLNDQIISGVDGMGKVSISELARRTVALISGGVK